MKPWQKNVLSVIVVIIIGFILFLLAFLLLALIINAAESLSPREGGVDVYRWSRIGLLILTVLLLPFVFKSKLTETLKAAYLTLPLMTALVMIGIALHARPSWMTYTSGAIVITATLVYIIMRKKSWVYSFAVVFVAVVALYSQLRGMQI